MENEQDITGIYRTIRACIPTILGCALTSRLYWGICYIHLCLYTHAYLIYIYTYIYLYTQYIFINIYIYIYTYRHKFICIARCYYQAYLGMESDKHVAKQKTVGVVFNNHQLGKSWAFFCLQPYPRLPLITVAGD